MRRRAFDGLASVAGLVLAAVLVVAGGLALWGHNFVDSQVGSQLAAQKIVFPTKSNPEFKALPAADAAAMGQYAGQPMTTGEEAKVYADNFIAFHLSKMGGTYSQLSAASVAQPNNAKLAALVNTVFKGTTLRAMLLNAYGWWKVSQITYIAAICAFVLAGLSAVGAGAGFARSRRVGPAAKTTITAAGTSPSKAA